MTQIASRTLLCVGDSTTAGTPGFFSPRERPPDGLGNPESQYAYWIVKAKPSWVVLNRGVRGQRTDQMLRRLSWDAEGHAIDAVVVLGGANDIHQNKEFPQIQSNLRELYRRSLEIAPRVLACSILPLNLLEIHQKEKVNEMNAWISEYARQYRLGFCDTYRALVDPAREGFLRTSPDEIHPDVEGYRLMGEVILRSLLSHWPELETGKRYSAAH